MGNKFYLRFDDKKHALTKENGIPIDAIGGLLEKLSKAINIENSKIVLSGISGNCYQLELHSEDQSAAVTFKQIHEALASDDQHKLSPAVREYGKHLGKIIKKHGVFAVALNAEKGSIAKIIEFKNKKAPVHFHETKTLYGKIVQIGSRSKEQPYQIVVQDYDGNLHTIMTDEDQDQQLSRYLSKIYRKSMIEWTLSCRVNIEDDKVEEAKLVGFHIPKEKGLWESLNGLHQAKENLFEKYGVDVSGIDIPTKNGE